MEIHSLLLYCQFGWVHLYENVHNWEYFHNIDGIMLAKCYGYVTNQRVYVYKVLIHLEI